MNKGFTLLELLVVVSIVAILMGLLVISFSVVQARGRDARRREDVKAIQDALEQYHANNDFVYPIDAATCRSEAVNFLNTSLPTDPSSGNDYDLTCDGDTYCVCALLERPGLGNSNVTNCSAWISAGDYFCAGNLQ